MTPAPPDAEQWRRWRIDPEWSRQIDVPSWDGHTRRWHVLERRPDAAAITVVCVHGNPTWSFLWRDVLARCGERARVVAVDQLGMGFSERTPRRRYAERVRDLDDVITALAIDGPLVVAGHDWGGAIAMGWAVRGDRRLAGLVLCNTGIAVPEGRSAPGLIRLAAAGPVTDLVGRRTRTFVEGTIGLSRARLAPEVRDALRAPYRSAMLRPAIADFVDDVPFTAEHSSSGAIADVAERVRSLTVPVLLAWGAQDPVFDDSFALDLADRLPHADRHRFPRAGHLSPLEVDVAGAVDAWLDDRVLRREPPAELPVAGAAAFEPVWSRLEQRRDDPTTAFVDASTGGRTSFAELHDRVLRTAAGLREIGVQPGERVAILVPPSTELVVAIYAVWRAGGITVVADRGLGLRGLGRAVRGAHVEWAIGPPKALAAARVLRWARRARTIAVAPRRVLGAVATFAELAASSAPVPPPPGPDDAAAVLYTSGATGPAKGVRYRHGPIAAQREALLATYGISGADRFVAAFAPFALYGPALGITSTLPDVDVTKPATLTAATLGSAAAAIDATIVFAAPAALANVVRTSDGPDPRLSRVRLVLSAGAPVPAATLRAMSVLCPAAELHTPYGMTECLPVADISLTEIESVGPGRGVCVGHPVSGAEVLIAELDFDAGAVVSPVAGGETGEVLVRAAWASEGYDQLWRTQRDARPRDAGGVVWHRSGDVGHIDAEGRLWIEGRSVHVVWTAEGAVTPVPLEVAVESLDGIDRSAAVGVGPRGCQQLVVVVEQPGIRNGLAPAGIAERVRAVISPVVGVPVAAVLTVDALPVDIRHNTKIDRTAVAAWASVYLAGGARRTRW